MYRGNYSNSIDGKGRCILPAKFRPLLGERCVLVNGFDPCVYLFSVEDYDAYVKEYIVPLPDEDDAAAKVKFYFYSSVYECDIDAQGRITIPQKFLDHANIVKEMENIGFSNRIEIWAKQDHSAHMEDILKKDIKALRKQTLHYRVKP
ncbi:MAG: division/cell wall cluster transcriptional repressor MraZ [Clostridiales Family XIII bacterium]|jgi:MraZ protein|nr:division/cell wall cluster transcriptional repressor MraZ [Clostridiales Family XIII bacterium]